MHLVDDDDLAGQSQVSHGQVRGTHYPEQQVVHGGDDEVRQHRLLAPVEPGQDRQVGSAAVLGVCGTARSSLFLIPSDPDRAWGLAGRVVERPEEPVADLVTAASQKLRLLVESRPSVQELSCELRRRPLVGVGLLNALQPVELAGEHGIRRRLGGEGEEDSGTASAGSKHLCGHEGGLGLPSSHGLLDDEHARQAHRAGGLECARLDVGGTGTVGQVEATGEQTIGAGAIIVRMPWRRDLQTRQASGRTKGMGVGREQARTIVLE